MHMPKWFKYWFGAYVFGSNLQLFQLIVFLKPDFNWWSSFALSSVHKAPTGTWSFVSVIANLPEPVELVITRVDDHVKMKLTSQIINGISRVLQKLLRCFNSTIIAVSFALPSARVFLAIFILNLSDSGHVNPQDTEVVTNLM